MYYFVVAIYLLIAGHAQGPLDILQYKGDGWPTIEACQAFLKTDDATLALVKLRDAAAAGYGAPGDKVLLSIGCSKDDAAGQPVNIPGPPDVKGK